MLKAIDEASIRITSMKSIRKNIFVTGAPTTEGKMTVNHRTAVFKDVSTDEEVWVPIGQPYKVRSEKGLTDHESIDGKPIKEFDVGPGTYNLVDENCCRRARPVSLPSIARMGAK
jgi:hypothetical protein